MGVAAHVAAWVRVRVSRHLSKGDGEEHAAQGPDVDAMVDDFTRVEVDHLRRPVHHGRVLLDVLLLLKDLPAILVRLGPGSRRACKATGTV